MKIKALFTDFYDTIVKDDYSIIEDFASEISSLTGESQEEINNFWLSTFHNRCDNSSGPSYKKQREIEEITVKSLIDKYKINKQADYFTNKIFSYWENPIPYSDALFMLNNTVIPVYVVSNIDTQDINKAIRNNDLCFDGVITSEDTESYKPDPGIFQTALSRFNLKKDEVFHIGDSLNADVNGAESFGIKSIWVNRKNFSSNIKISPYREYNNLYQFYNDFKEIL